jgi:hypothetical protein
MAVNRMSDLKTGKSYVTNSPQLVFELVPFEPLLGTNVCEDSVSPTLANVEGLSVSWVDQSVHVRLEPPCYLWRK